MKPLNTKEIRHKFIQYFEKNDHLKIQASSIVPQNDPTLLFINSGMAPLKNYFLGKETPEVPRLCNYQPCIRTKDIDDVGDRHHLTIFEMLGSWSIGDYYKERAIELAYDLLVNELGFDPKKLYVTVYEGSKEWGILADEVSAKAWEKVGVSPDHIVRKGIDNFWGPAGETGPCGPCTEVFFDTGEAFGPAYKPGGHFDDVSRYIEIWNAGVFMELNKQKDGSFTPLPLKSVDTGSGLERMAMVMNGFDSVYETDLLKPLVELSQQLLEIKKPNESDMRAIRMISDHMRAATFILGEGVMPNNDGQGYIPRRLIRKCVASFMGRKIEKINLSSLCEKTIELLGDFYPQLKSAKETILYNIKNEIEEFVPIVKTGLEKIEEELKQQKGKQFSGQKAFELVTTFGMPLDVIQTTLSERGIELNIKEYESSYEEHRKTSRVISRKGSSQEMAALEEACSQLPETKFSGYEGCRSKGKILALIQDQKVVGRAGPGEFFLVTDQTPFYAESGGQVGDRGEIKGPKTTAEVLDTIKVNKRFVHHCKLNQGHLSKDEDIELIVEERRRLQVRRNHSATHLMHAALHKVVGQHATQKGSLVTEEKLRFDFQHNQALTEEEKEKIEYWVNLWIQENFTTTTDLKTYDQALEAGALALFGEKYDAKVRVVSFGGASVELCGGTHVERTGEIGLFVITNESSVAKGVRRIEAVTGEMALKLIQKRRKILGQIAKELNASEDNIHDRLKDLKKKMVEKKKTPTVKQGNIQYRTREIIEVKGKSLLMGLLDLEDAQIKEYGDQLMNKKAHDFVCLIGTGEKSLKAFCWVQKNMVKTLKASDLLKKILSPIDGKGGGPPHFAQGGSPKVDQINLVFQEIENGKDFIPWFESQL